MQSFFKAAPAASPSPATAAVAATTAPQAEVAVVATAPAEAGGFQATAPKKELTAYERRFPRPPPENLVRQPTPPQSTQKVDSALKSNTSFEECQSDLQAFLKKVADTRRCQKIAPPSSIGLPPSWARRPGAQQVAALRLEELRESGVDPSAVRIYRRKFIWFEGDGSERPPYYGSWPRPGPEVRPRRYLGQDATLDYEVMSDQDWEEEPEGMSLSDDEDDLEDGEEIEDPEKEDSFMVEDGYLSEDEGIKSDDDILEAESSGLLAALLANAEGAGGGDGNPAGGGAGDMAHASRLRANQMMQVMLDRAKRSAKPLIIMRKDLAERVEVGEGDGVSKAWVNGDSAALEALALEVLIPGVSFTPPEDPARAEPVAAAAAGGTAAKQALVGAGGAGRPKSELLAELLPSLAHFITQNSSMQKAKLIDGFIQGNAAMKLTKKWVGEKITYLADRQQNRWTIRQGILEEVVGKKQTKVDQQSKSHSPNNQNRQNQPAIDATPAPTAAASGPLDRLLNKSGIGTASKPTPAVPSALRPSEPPSTVKASGRLVTTTAAGEAAIAAAARATATTAAVPQQHQALQPLTVPQVVEGTGDDYWVLLLQHIEADATTIETLSFTRAFEPNALAHTIAALPAFIIDALLASAEGQSTREASKAEAAVRCLRAAVEALACLENGSSAQGKEASASQRAWGEARTGSHAASLAGLCREPGFVEVLQGSIRGNIGGDAAVHAVAMVETLAKSPAVKELSKGGVGKIRESLVQRGDDAAGALKAWNNVDFA